MNWNLLLPLVVTTVIATVGWIVVHTLAVKQDVEKKRREIRLNFLLGAYRKLENSVLRGPMHEDRAMALDFEASVADIQLLGTVEQSQLARNLALAIGEQDPEASASRLLHSIRDELRKELRLEELNDGPVHIRFVTGS